MKSQYVGTPVGTITTILFTTKPSPLVSPKTCPHGFHPYATLTPNPFHIHQIRSGIIGIQQCISRQRITRDTGYHAYIINTQRFSLSASLQAILPVKLQVTSPNSKICLVLILINSIYKYTFPHLFLYSFQDNQSQFKLVPTVIISHMESDRIGLFRQIDVSYMYSVFRHFLSFLVEIHPDSCFWRCQTWKSAPFGFSK